MKTLNVGRVKIAGQAGFTIIELIVVILLLGILTATALPRFIDVTDDAHTAVINAVIGGVSTANALFHAQYIANGEPAADTALTGFGDSNVLTNSTGFPGGIITDGDASLGAADAGDDTACANIFDNVLQSGHPVVAANATANTDPTDAEQDTANGAGTDFIAVNAAGVICRYIYVGNGGTGITNDVVILNTATGNVTTGTL